MDELTRGEALRCAAFVAVVIAVLVSAAWLAFRRVWARPAGMSWFEKGVYAAAVAGIACMLYGHYVEPYWLVVRRETIAVKGLAAPVRLIHFSDLHCDAKVRLEDTLAAACAVEKPDLITFSGDSVNGPEGLEHFRRTMTALTQVAPVYAAYGNWDTYINAGLNYYGGLSVHHLSAGGELVTVRGAKLWVAGVDVGKGQELAKVFAARPAGVPAVLIHHYPDLVEDAAALGCDVYLCGHTHGGQVALPGYGALVTFSRFGKTYERGLNRCRDTWIYTNPGIGMEGQSAPRVRFWVRPELTVLELVPAK